MIQLKSSLSVLSALILGSGLSIGGVGCDGSSNSNASATHEHDEHDGHTHAEGEAAHEHEHAAGATHEDHGAVTQLGEQQVNGYTVKVSRDGDVTAGGEAPIDVWVSGAATVSAVRFWIGTEDAKGSMKAKADREGDHWHTHCEVPKPLMDGAKLWVEFEAEGGAKGVAGFELKM